MSETTLEQKAKPTNLDLQRQIAEVHSCTHQVGREVKELAETVRTDRHDSRGRDMILEGRLAEIDKRLARSEGSLDAMITFFGIRPSSGDGEVAKPRKTLSNLEWWQAVLGIAGSVVGALAGWKYLWPAVVAAHHAILAAN
jgi:hypothetical protein